MKLLFITQKIDKNDDVLGFVLDWLSEFSRQTEGIVALCLQQGEFSLPGNVRVFSLGKEKMPGGGPIRHWLKRLVYLSRFYYYCFSERKNYDAVFVHMNQIYVIYGWWLFKLLNKKVGLWYAHGAVPKDLPLAEKLADVVFTSTADGFRLASRKLKIVGQGIETEKFSPSIEPRPPRPLYTIITVGRISAVKNLDLIVEAGALLKQQGLPFVIKFAGTPLTAADKKYYSDLLQLIAAKGLDDSVVFAGAIAYRQVADFYRSADLFINVSDTGSLDKAILEAMASGLSVLTSNDSAKKILPQEFIVAKDPAEIAAKITALMQEPPRVDLRQIVTNGHSLKGLVEKILSYY